MKQLLLILISSSFLSLACRKDTPQKVPSAEGKWNWQSSLQDNGSQLNPSQGGVTDTTFLIFNGDEFTNRAWCVIGGASEGTFELTSVSGQQVLILNSPYGPSDTFWVKMSDNRLELTARYPGYSWTHTFLRNREWQP